MTQLHVATGHAILGVTLAPAAAVATRELMCDGRSGVDLSPFDPARFMRGQGVSKMPRAVYEGHPTNR